MQKHNYDIVLKIIKFHFPMKKIFLIEYIAEGRVNDVFKIQLEDKKLLIKIQRNIKKCEQAFGNEYYILEESEFMPEIVPQVYYLDREGKKFGKKYFICEYIEGKILEGGSERSFFLAGQTLSRIHSCNTGYIGGIQNKVKIHTIDDVYNYYYTYYKETLDKVQKIDYSLAGLIFKYLKKQFSISYYVNQTPVLLHNDVHLKNIVISGEKIRYIDWDCSKYAHREVDFVKIKHLTENGKDKDKIKYFIQGYETVDGCIFTPNFKCHEVIWLAKMLVFEHYNPIERYGYFKPESYYKNEIIKICK